jgi:hypothetical protein
MKRRFILMFKTLINFITNNRFGNHLELLNGFFSNNKSFVSKQNHLP